MTPEDISKITLFLQSKNGLKNILNVENLIIAKGDPQAINNLRNGGSELNELNIRADESILNVWSNLLKEQVAYSISQVKKKKS